MHIDAETLRRHPILGVLIGGLMAAFIGFLMLSGLPEVRVLLGQKAPDHVSLHEAVNQRGARWVTISEGQWQCDHVVTLERTGLTRWIAGLVVATEVPITGPTHGEVLVANFDGPVKCEDRAGKPLTGVVGSTEIYTSRDALRRWGQTGYRVAILQVDASPRSAMWLLVALAGIAVLGLAFAGYYLAVMLRSSRRPAPLPNMEPIQ